MKAFIFVLIAVSLTMGLKEDPLKFLQARTEDDYIPDPNGYTENPWDLVWVILRNCLEGSETPNNVFLAMYSCASIDSIQDILNQKDSYCSYSNSGAYLYVDAYYIVSSELFDVPSECQIENWSFFQYHVDKCYQSISSVYPRFLEIETNNESTIEDDTDSLSSTIIGEDPPMYANNIVNVYVTINECEESAEDSQGKEETEEEQAEEEVEEEQAEEEIEEEEVEEEIEEEEVEEEIIVKEWGDPPRTDVVIATFNDEFDLIC